MIAGLGALLIRRSTAGRLMRPRYFGGGAVDAVLPTRDMVVARPGAAMFQPGTPAFLEFVAALHGFKLLTRIGGLQVCGWQVCEVRGHHRMRCRVPAQHAGVLAASGVFAQLLAALMPL